MPEVIMSRSGKTNSQDNLARRFEARPQSDGSNKSAGRQYSAGPSYSSRKTCRAGASQPAGTPRSASSDRRPGKRRTLGRHLPEPIPNPFNIVALWIVRHFGLGSGHSRSRMLGKNEKLSRELMELGTGRKNCVQSYYVKKISGFLMVALGCLAVLTVILVVEHRQDRRITDGVLERPDYGEGGKDQSLMLRIGEEESEAFDVHLDARAYTRPQIRTLLNNATSRLEELLPGENASLDAVRTALCLPTTLEDGAVSVEYYITPGGLIDEDGSICGEPEPEGSLVMINATLTCQDKTSTYECAARIFPPILSASEQLQENIRSAVEAARTADPTGAQVKLPDSVDGKALSWSYPKDSSLTLIMILMLVLPIAYWAREDSKIHDAAKERLSQLELDYSQLLWKLTMLLSAGLTIRGAFTRITDQYEAEHTSKRYVYEEMLLTLREMRSGVPEASAYENFGRRCSLPAYIKLGSLLSQNLKKGSKGLTALLEHEAVLSMDQHKMAVRKLGERASVKMLLPMILMFGVVLVILMVPAFLSM